MFVNSTPSYVTDFVAPPPPSKTGLTVGLTLFFLLLATGAAVLAYLFKRKFRNAPPSPGDRGTRTKQDYCETPQTDPHQHISTIREQPASQNPVYENLNAHKPAFNMPPVNHRRSNLDNQEDLYLQCDPIYSNDPDCSLVIHPESHDEDLYIVPQS